jgi:glutamate-1-semialdehyde 2,1-aminomutase
MSTPINGPIGQSLWRRADAALPGGLVYMSRSARFAGDDVLPGFIRRAEGCRITDVDGREYIDFVCSNGPNLLGYQHPEVEAAAINQAALMDLASFYPEAIVDYAERLLAWGKGFDWTILAKNGSDTTSLAGRIMRVATNKPHLVLFQSAYHGFDPEYSVAFEQVPTDGQSHILRVPWNDASALQALFQRHGAEIAGMLLNPLDQNPLQETREPDPTFIAAIKAAQENGAMLAIDDVRHGFRLHPKGSHHALGLDPDLLCLGKGLANGYATAAILAKEALREAAQRIQFTATYMFSAVAYRAGIATLDIYQRDEVFTHMVTMGQRLKDGFIEAAAATGHEINYCGPVTMPTFLFNNDPKAKRARQFARHAARNGAIFHPTLNWFLSGAHTHADIDEAINIAKIAFTQTPVEESAP